MAGQVPCPAMNVGTNLFQKGPKMNFFSPSLDNRVMPSEMVPSLRNCVVTKKSDNWVAEAVDIFLRYSVVIITDAFDDALCDLLSIEEA